MNIEDLQVDVWETGEDDPKATGTWIQTDDKGIHIGQPGAPNSLLITFNQTIYLSEEAGDLLNEKLFEIWKKYISNAETNLDTIAGIVASFIGECFEMNEASYDQDEYETYKKLTESPYDEGESSAEQKQKIMSDKDKLIEKIMEVLIKAANEHQGVFDCTVADKLVNYRDIEKRCENCLFYFPDWDGVEGSCEVIGELFKRRGENLDNIELDAATKPSSVCDFWEKDIEGEDYGKDDDGTA